MRRRVVLLALLFCSAGPPVRVGPAAAGSGPPGGATPRGTPADSFAVRWRVDAGLEGVARHLAESPGPWRPLPGIGPLESVLDTVEVWLVRNPRRAEGLGLGGLEPWVAGLAEPGSGRIVLRAGEELREVGEVARVLRHEVAHLGLHAATGGRHPRWLTEGYAQLVAGEWGWEDAWAVRLAFLRRGGSSLESVSLRLRGNRLQARLGYLLAYTAVHHLWERGGEAGLAALFERLRAGETVDAALRQVYGVSEASFEREWRRSVASRYGWLYALSRAALFWLVVTVLVAALFVRRLRRDRDRLQALREAERAEAEAAEAGPVEERADPPGR